MTQNFKQFILTDEETTFQRVHELLEAENALNNRSATILRDSIMNSFSVSVYDGDNLIGFARAITDYHSTSVILDVVVDKRYRKNGLGRAIFDFFKSHPKLGHTNQLLWASGGGNFFGKLGFRKVNRDLYFRK